MLRSSLAVPLAEIGPEPGDRPDCDETRANTVQKDVPPNARLWGFVRHTRDRMERDPELKETDVRLWLDGDRCRFLVARNRVVKDDLAPIEFVQFVRELRHSTTQLLFKYETRGDGAVGRPVCVWL
jgi:hypothetical protein